MAEGVIDGHVFESPHCNSEVLHAPGVCYYCDHYPSRQAAREASGATFSPPEANGWRGNVAASAPFGPGGPGVRPPQYREPEG